jgi:hypothetical protein
LYTSRRGDENPKGSSARRKRLQNAPSAWGVAADEHGIEIYRGALLRRIRIDSKLNRDFDNPLASTMQIHNRVRLWILHYVWRFAS